MSCTSGTLQDPGGRYERWSLALAVAASAWSAGSVSAEAPAGARGRHSDPQSERVEALHLTLTFPAEFAYLQRLPEDAAGSQRKAAWSARVGGAEVWIEVYGMPREEFGYVEPDDVTENVIEHLQRGREAAFTAAGRETVTGPFGLAGHAALAWGVLREQGKDGSFFVLGGLDADHGYAVEIGSTAPLPAASASVVLTFLRGGVACSTPARDPRWSQAEVEARWRRDAPPDLVKKLEKPVRTKHYVFLSNTGAARQMGEQMEKFYATIQELYPFPEVEGRCLMPVFLFRTPEQYHEFFVKNLGASLEEARKSKGVAFKDFYATYYDAPQDPIHLHEATHQVFSSRLRLGGGGSWFQEGVAEYASTRASDRTDAANLVKKGRHVKLADFLRIESLLWSESEADRKSDDAASTSYRQAALLIEFLKESRWSKAKFQDWLQAVGKCPPNDLAAIEQATQRTLGVDLTDLEQRWIVYCKGR